jgi:hypothetical protein
MHGQDRVKPTRLQLSARISLCDGRYKIRALRDVGVARPFAGERGSAGARAPAGVCRGQFESTDGDDSGGTRLCFA